MTLSEAELRKKAKSAVQSLQIAIDSIQHRYERFCEKKNLAKPNLRDLQICMKRINTWLKALLLKQASLSLAMRCLIETTWPSICQALDDELQQKDKKDLLQRVCPLLEHLFTQLIRLHDGLILCISGECRHQGDIRAAQRSKYPSQLNQQGLCDDGVTQLYSCDLHYSGESWDDFHDPKCGSKQQLLRQLEKLVPKSQRADLWNVLVDKGAMAFDALLDEIQNDRESVQSDCTSFKNRINLELKLLLQKHGSNVKVDLRLLDKMEKFHVKVDALEWKFERFANTFQVTDPAGALPLLFTREEWMRVMKPPQSAAAETKHALNKKKRRVILDSSESEDDERNCNISSTKANSSAINTKTAVASGLVVKAQQVKPAKAACDEPASVNEIKQQMGVNVEQLAEARQMVEEEEAATRRAANIVDEAPEDETDLETCMQQVSRLKKVLALAKLKNKPNEIVWNAQECLREACMNAGNACLEAVDDLELLEQAITYFDLSQNLCEDQQELLGRMSTVTDDPEFSHRSVSQRYTLLLGRAQANSGIARAELSRQLEGCESKRFDREARKHLESALELTVALVQDIKQHGTTIDDIIDLMNTHELGILIRQWVGKLFWNQWQRRGAWSSLKASIDIFKQTSCVMAETDPTDTMFSDEVSEATLKVLVQEYFALATFADLAVASLEEAQSPHIRENMEMYDFICDEAIEGIKNAAYKSQRLYALVSLSHDVIANELFLNEQGMLLSSDLLQLCSKLEEDWKHKKELLMQPLQKTDRTIDVGRSDVPISDLAPSRPFAGRIVLGKSARNKKPQKVSKGHSNFGVSRHTSYDAPNPFDNESQPAEPTQRRYRRWGDELLPQTIDEHGRSVPKLEYPAIAPELPAELKAQWEENMRRKAAAEAS
ncbi:hypothetical protein MPSEU_000192200 [Mayamaea pseudoterrestris]|nr:hypothetical protein MPSEU_000192200 [Mayamaea pseudoterrestris]